MASLLFLLWVFQVHQTALKVIVQNVQVGKGSIVVSLYNEEKDFLNKPMASQTLKATEPIMQFSFSVPPGDYAIAAYQDLNENKKLDAGIFHIPKEPYGFSNNYRPAFSAPQFKDCVIKISGDSASAIDLK